MNGTITISAKAGARRTGSDNTPQVTHARLSGGWRAMCGTTPDKTGDWSMKETVIEIRDAARGRGPAITCPKCYRAVVKHWNTPYDTSIR